MVRGEGLVAGVRLRWGPLSGLPPPRSELQMKVPQGPCPEGLGPSLDAPDSRLWVSFPVLAVTLLPPSPWTTLSHLVTSTSPDL